MIHVIASVQVRPGKVEEFLNIFRVNLPVVRAEKGCIRYIPMVDTNADLLPQMMDENMVIIIEAWESLEALRNHLGTQHMLAYREKVSSIVENVSLKILKEV